MQSTVLLCFAALVACACAQVYEPLGYAAEEYPEFYHPSKIVRHPRDLGSMDESTYTRGGFNDYPQNSAFSVGGSSSQFGGLGNWFSSSPAEREIERYKSDYLYDRQNYFNNFNNQRFR